jgi:hypothetical protein
MAIRRVFAAVSVAVMALAFAACRPSEPLTVSTIQVGRSANSDGSVGNHTTRFRPDDTMHAAVITSGRGSGLITVKWSYQGRPVSEESKDVTFFESGSTEFHIKLPGGFPPGDYRVEVLVDGKAVGERTMRVERE